MCLSKCTNKTNVIKEIIVAIIAPEKYPEPHANPIPPHNQIVAAVVKPFISVPF